MKNKITVVIFCLVLGFLSVLNLIMPKREYSENENRYLSQMPEFSFASLFAEEDKDKFTTKFESFITDQFVYRDGWVGMKTETEKLLQKRDSGGVYFADDDYLIEMFDTVDNKQYEKNIAFLKEFSEKMKSEQGLDVHTMLVPTASYTLSDKLPSHAPEVSQDELLDYAMEQLPNFVDVRDTLKNHKDEYIYYRTDHHWTSLGVYYVYQQWCQIAGLSQTALESYSQEVLSSAFYGTTYSKACLYTTPPDTILAFHPAQESDVNVTYQSGDKITQTDILYETSYLATKDKYSVFLNGNQPVTKIATGNHNGRRLLLIKDSYANAFAPFAAEDYEEVYLIDLRYMKDSLSQFIQENEINEILVLYNLKGFSSDNNLYLITK